MGLLDSLATLCSKDSLTDLVTLAFNSLKDGSSNSPQPPSEMWYVDSKLPVPVIVDCYTDVAPILEEVSLEEENISNGSSIIEAIVVSPGSSAKTGGLVDKEGSKVSATKSKARSCSSLHKTKASSSRLRKANSVKLVPKNMTGSGDLHKNNSESEACLDSKTKLAEEGKKSGNGEEDFASPPQLCTNIEVMEGYGGRS